MTLLLSYTVVWTFRGSNKRVGNFLRCDVDVIRTLEASMTITFQVSQSRRINVFETVA